MTAAGLALRALATVRLGLALARAHPSALLGAALAVAFVGWAHSCNRAARAAGDVSRAAERARVEAAGVAAVYQADRRELERSLESAQAAQAAATRQASKLSEQVKALLSAASGARVIRVERGDTGWVKPGGPAPEPAPAPGGAARGEPPPGRVCLYHQGDEGRIATSNVAARYRAGTVGVVGTADAFARAGPGAPELHLFGGPLRIDAKALGEGVRPPGWAYGLGAGVSGRGALGAVLLETPPARLPLLGWPVRAWVVGAGGAGEGLVLGGVRVEP